MIIPEHVNARWLATLGDEQLMEAEAELHTLFRHEEITEKRRSGERYMLLHGPSALVNAWHRWSLVSNETRQRGLLIHRHR